MECDHTIGYAHEMRFRLPIHNPEHQEITVIRLCRLKGENVVKGSASPVTYQYNQEPQTAIPNLQQCYSTTFL